LFEPGWNLFPNPFLYSSPKFKIEKKWFVLLEKREQLAAHLGTEPFLARGCGILPHKHERLVLSTMTERLLSTAPATFFPLC
jgi:hypothetical protein